jgi:hypothetical protein
MNARTPQSIRATLSAMAGLAVAVLAACSSSEAPSTPACHAGDSEACTCDDGTSGHRICGATACTCGAAASDSGSTGNDAGTVDPDAGDGGHLHDGGPTATDAAPGTYGSDCTSNADCTDAVYNYCFIGGNRNFCTKACPGGSADCPNPPTGGVCNMKGYCK